jgi:hypothetical protein
MSKNKKDETFISGHRLKTARYFQRWLAQRPPGNRRAFVLSGYIGQRIAIMPLLADLCMDDGESNYRASLRPVERQ